MKQKPLHPRPVRSIPGQPSRHDNVWFIVQMMDELDLTDFLHGGVNITGFRVVLPENEKVQQAQRELRSLRSDKFWGAGPGANITV